MRHFYLTWLNKIIAENSELGIELNRMPKINYFDSDIANLRRK